MHSFSARIIGLLLLSLLSSTARGAEGVECQPGRWRQVEHVPFKVPEVWPFELHWGMVKAGTATLSVESIEDMAGRPAYHLSMDMQATGLVGMVHPYQDRTDTWLDRDALVTVFSRQAVRDGSYRMEQTVRFEPECQRFERHKNRLHENRKTEHAGRLSPDSLDLYGALYYLRTQPLEVDKTYELTLFAGDAAVAVRAHVQRKERLRVPAGSFECFLISLSADAPAASKVKEVKWWLSVDDQHIPVRVRTKIGIGHITADLAVSPVKRSD